MPRPTLNAIWTLTLPKINKSIVEAITSILKDHTQNEVSQIVTPNIDLGYQVPGWIS